MRTSLLIASLFLAVMMQAAHLRVHGLVTDHNDRTPLAQAVVWVFKDGMKQDAFTTGAGGRYRVLLENNAHYVIRFSMPGRVTKCFAVDTHGPAWEGDDSVKDLEVEMTLFEEQDGLDLSFFDLPMGMARFTPMTGMVRWNADYVQRVRPEVDRLMAEVALRRERQRALAQSGALASVAGQ